MAHDVGANATLQRPPARPLWMKALVRVIAFTAIWWLLTDGSPDAWLIGAPLVLLAVAASLALTRGVHSRWSLLGMLRFVPYFLWESLRGGIAAATIVLRRPGHVDPQMVSYRTVLPPGAPRALFAGITGLLPGTLAADIRDDRLEVHVLDSSIPALDDLARLERRIAAMIGLSQELERRSGDG